jgi:hypothetical protein
MEPVSPLRVCALAAAGLLLSACGAITPGAAATVDDHTISMSTLDDTARVYCEVTALQAQQQGVQSVDNAQIRRQAATDLVLTRVAEDLATERGLTAPPPVEADPTQLVDAFGADRAPEVAETLGAAQDLYNLFAVIAADDRGVKVTDENSEDLADAGRTIVLAAFADHDVEFAPRLGLSDSGEADGSIGSLSVAPADTDAPAGDELAGPLACRA